MAQNNWTLDKILGAKDNQSAMYMGNATPSKTDAVKSINYISTANSNSIPKSNINSNTNTNSNTGMGSSVTGAVSNNTVTPTNTTNDTMKKLQDQIDKQNEQIASYNKRSEDQIAETKNAYNAALEAKRAAVRAAVNAAKGKINTTIENAPGEYQIMRNNVAGQADVNQLNMRRSLARLGYTPNEDSSQILEGNNNNAKFAQLNQLDTAQKKTIDDARASIAQLEAQGQFDDAAAVQEYANKTLEKISALRSQAEANNINMQNMQTNNLKSLLDYSTAQDNTAYNRKTNEAITKFNQDITTNENNMKNVEFGNKQQILNYGTVLPATTKAIEDVKNSMTPEIAKKYENYQNDYAARMKQIDPNSQEYKELEALRLFQKVLPNAANNVGFQNILKNEYGFSDKMIQDIVEQKKVSQGNIDAIDIKKKAGDLANEANSLALEIEKDLKKVKVDSAKASLEILNDQVWKSKEELKLIDKYSEIEKQTAIKQIEENILNAREKLKLERQQTNYATSKPYYKDTDGSGSGDVPQKQRTNIINALDGLVKSEKDRLKVDKKDADLTLNDVMNGKTTKTTVDYWKNKNSAERKSVADSMKNYLQALDISQDEKSSIYQEALTKNGLTEYL